MGICSMAQETQTGALYQSKGMGWGGRWEGDSKGRGYMHTYGWFILRFHIKQNSIKQLSFNKKIIYFKKTFYLGKTSYTFPMSCSVVALSPIAYFLVVSFFFFAVLKKKPWILEVLWTGLFN